jgi:2-methylisocitrate lyase-like PEP mutase family enzyme
MSKTRPSAGDKRRTFRRLHETGCFVIPNPWDAGSARYFMRASREIAEHGTFGGLAHAASGQERNALFGGD